MLSYMVPSLEEKPPPVPQNPSTSAASKDHRLQLSLAPDRLTNGQLTNGHHAAPASTATGAAPGGRKGAAVSTESSASSLSSGDTHEKPKPKLLNGGTKHTSLKRVSFGSSKGSMVETLIYESPLQEEPEGSPTTSGSDVNSTSQAADPETDGARAPSKVRVTFFEQERPLVVSSPDDTTLLLDATMTTTILTTTTTTTHQVLDHHNTTYNRQESTDSGWDNPFRPDGDLSREADEIVQLIKGGKQLITQTHAHEVDSAAASAVDQLTNGALQTTQTQLQSSSPTKPVNGSTDKQSPAAAAKTGAVELQRSVTANDASQVEHVVLKKKPKCKCCVIQ